MPSTQRDMTLAGPPTQNSPCMEGTPERGDYRNLNKITTPDPFPIPRIDDLIDELNSAKYLTKIDLNKGFLQIPVNENDQPKTAFQTPWGQFEFTRMPFGLMNAPGNLPTVHELCPARPRTVLNLLY